MTLIRTLGTEVVACSSIGATVAWSDGRYTVIAGIAIPQIADAV